MYNSLLLQHTALSQGGIILLISTLFTAHLANVTAGILAFSWQYYLHFVSTGREI
jgi:hypothetical protein